jgi:hypothetical protein
MDPNATLAELVRQTSQLQVDCTAQDRTAALTTLDEIEENVGNLAEWLRKGGFIPA